MEKYLVTLESSYLWKVWTDKDLKSDAKLNRYMNQSTRGFNQMLYANKTTVDHVLGEVRENLN